MVDDFLGQRKLWEFASHADPFVRRAVYRLLHTSVSRSLKSLDLMTISNTLLLSSLATNQAGSAYDYAKALATLSQVAPEVWTQCYTGSGKKSATKRLCQFLGRGSQGSPSVYWGEITTLLHHVPRNVLFPPDVKPFKDFVVIEALHDGVASKDDSRYSAGWTTYLEFVGYISSFPDIDRSYLIQSSILPLLDQYVNPSSDGVRWAVSGKEQREICVQAARLASIAQEVLEREWKRLSASIIQDLEISLPEQSKDHAKSQDLVSAAAWRWYGLQGDSIQGQVPAYVKTLVLDIATSDIRSAISILIARKGKPYGAASLVEAVIKSMANLILESDPMKTMLIGFFQNDVPGLVHSPSAPYLIRTLPNLEGVCDVNTIYQEIIQLVVEEPDSATKYTALRSLFDSPYLSNYSKDKTLSATFRSLLKQAINEHSDDIWKIITTALSNTQAPPRVSLDLLTEIVDGLYLDDQVAGSMHGLGLVTRHDRKALKAYIASADGNRLLARLISLCQAPDDLLSQQAKTLSESIEGIASADPGEGHRKMVEVIRKEIDIADGESLEISSLVALAQKTIQHCDDAGRVSLAAELLPDSTRWNKVLEQHAESKPSPSLAIMNPMGCSTQLIDVVDISAHSTYDGYGYSSALRVAWFISALIHSTDLWGYAPVDRQSSTLVYLSIVAQMASDNLSIASANPLWKYQGPESEQDIIDFLSELQTLIASLIEGNGAAPFISNAQSAMLKHSHGVSVMSYYSGRAYVSLTIELGELYGDSQSTAEQYEIRSIRKASEFFAAAASLSTSHDSKGLTKLTNELLANLTEEDFSQQAEALRSLILFNCIITKEENEGILPTIPRQRLVFFVQNAIARLSGSPGKGQSTVAKSLGTPPSIAVTTEIFRALSQILSPLASTYGSFWESIFQVLQQLWSSEETIDDARLPMTHASLKLLSALRYINHEESNDDLQDAWKDHEASMTQGMINLLHVLRNFSDETHQPRKIVNELLARELYKQSRSSSTGSSLDVFPILASESLALQQSAYEIMHRQIPAAQEQISLDKVLSKDFVAKLPEELLSLILEVPTVKPLESAGVERSGSATLRSYMLSWKLIFDHWTNASDAVKSDYIAMIKEGSYLNDLLGLASDFLISSRVRPVDASKFDIEHYTPGVEETPEKDTEGFLIHLYYLSLKNLPSLSKSWWRDNTSRQTQTSVESWTEKHISPLIITSELSAVSAWAPTQASELDQPLTVKTSASTREITASIPVDEQTMILAINLPSSYPLNRATVSGLHRVGVTEQKWRSWTITTQGVINFSELGGGGQLIDGLVAWRKNVTATLKGQAECAICYSVVSADRQLPSKRCLTCKNLFHGSCLFKWFKSSNSSSCPLCRNQFSYA